MFAMNVDRAGGTQGRRFRFLALPLMAGILFCGVPSGVAQNGQNSSQSSASEGSLQAGANEAPEKHTWKIDQLIPLTVAQAWQMSGKNEDRFFDMVQDLAALSAKNRGLVLPQSEAAGRQAGEYIKQQAKQDHQQLLYVIVDRAVRKVGRPGAGNQAPQGNR